ncbi:alanine racemase [bacterium]|nr:alanine racemase [candidate division CSSED10-310 bacterium]
MALTTGSTDTFEHSLSWLEISASALRHNVTQFKSLIGARVQLYAVVKSNAYGHGMILVASQVLAAGADGLAVNSIDEVIQLRRQGIEAPILILGYVGLADLPAVLHYGAEPVLYNIESLIRLRDLAAGMGRIGPVHLKIETGTNRQGIFTGQLKDFLDLIEDSPSLQLRGISTHFANIEDTTVHTYAEQQIAIFEGVKREIEARGFNGLRCHAACTAAAVLFPRTYFDLVRVGIGLYGLWSSKETYLSALMKFREPLELIPVLRWKTRIAQIKNVPRGSYIGYGCSYRTTRDTVLAVLPIGYFEGYSRAFSNAAHVLIHGKRAPIRGRICMNICMADISDIPDVKVEDEVVLLGRDGEEEVSADFLAGLAHSINYEIVSRISSVLPRVLVD